ncbi:hypothetical protein F5B20DRAFT_589642 [Whalleya microplaca]|nr:hypothetical protein F5B20DRAFT_589642 [Whalleya microplaca]
MVESMEITNFDELALATLGTTITLCVLAIVTVVLRCWVRFGNKAFGIDDFSMILGLLFFIACCIFTCMGCYSGLGTPDAAIQSASVVFFQITYAWSLAFIKVSICVALLRITQAKRYVIPLWLVMLLSVGITFVAFVTLLVGCKPIAASWDAGVGECDHSGRVMNIAILISAIAILTDWSCAIIPAFILWNLNMRFDVKVSLVFVLALGVLASISTIVRFPYLHYYEQLFNYLYNVCNVVVWSIVECGIGIIAGSLPSLRPLVRNLGSGSKKTHPGGPSNGLTNGGNSIPLRSTAQGQSSTACEAGRNQQSGEIDDGSSQTFIIMKNTQIDVEYGSVKENPVQWGNDFDRPR